MVTIPSLGKPCAVAPRRRLTQCERELVACRAGYRTHTRQLRVYTQELYEQPVMVALITIRDGHAEWRDITSNGGLGKPEPIACNGSVSKHDMRKMIGCDFGTAVYAVQLHYSDLKYNRR